MKYVILFEIDVFINLLLRSYSRKIFLSLGLLSLQTQNRCDRNLLMPQGIERDRKPTKRKIILEHKTAEIQTWVQNPRSRQWRGRKAKKKKRKKKTRPNVRDEKIDMEEEGRRMKKERKNWEEGK